MMGPPEAAHHFEVDVSAAHRLVILPLRTHVVQVEAEDAIAEALEMLAVVEQSHALLDVGMSRVMLIARRRIGRQAGEELGAISIERQFLELLAVLEPKPDVFLRGVVENLVDA